MLLAWIGVLIAGWICALAVNYLVDILPYRRRITEPICLECQFPVRWVDYLSFHACRNCGKKRSLRTWIVQTAGVLALSLVYLYPPRFLGFWFTVVILVYFGVVLLIDLEHRLVLNPVVAVGIVIGCGIGVARHGIWSTLEGGAFGFLTMLILFFLGGQFSKLMSWLRKQEVEEEALGFGDVNLAGVVGLLIGWPGITLGLLLAILLGGLISGLLMMGMLMTRRYKAFVAIPYAPFIILGSIILLYR